MTKKKDEIPDFNKALSAGIEGQGEQGAEAGDEEVSYELSAAEKAKIEAEVRREIQAEAKREAMEAYKEEAKLKVKAAIMFAAGKDDSGEDLATIDFWLASYPKYAILDGKLYYSGKTYTKKRSVVAVLADLMWQSMKQEERRLGEKNEFTHMPQYQKIMTSKGLQIRPA